MIEIPVPKDIREYEPTLIGPFTTRQVLCAVVMVALVYAVYFIEKAVGVEDPMQAPVFLLFGIPPFLVGWVKPYGMHFEKFFSKAFRENFLWPAKRPYVVENMWDSIIEEEEKEVLDEMRKNGALQERDKEKASRTNSKHKSKTIPEECIPYK